MMYVYYAVILIILLAGVKFAGFREFNGEFMSLQESKAVQGVCAVLIIFHHMSQQLDYCSEIKYFLDVGILFVGIFFFCSGYGLIKSLKVKENYLQGFLKKRLITILVPFYLVNLVFMVYSWRTGVFDGLSGANLVKEVLLDLVGIKLLNGNAWYIIVITFIYIIFYFLFRYCQEIVGFIAMGIILVAYSFVGLYLDHGEWWFLGEWWYNTVMLFFIGMLFARFEETIVKGLKKVYYVALPVSIVAFAFAFRFSVKVLYAHSYWCEYMPSITRQEILRNRSMSLGTQIIAVVLFVLAVLLITMKFHFQNPVLKFLGTISLELYLIHDLFIQFYHSTYCNISKSTTYVAAVVLSSIASAFILWFLASKINKVLLKKK